MALRAAVELLPPRLLRVLELHYGDGLTLREIGEMFGVTESRVCQLQSEAVRILRTRYGEFAGESASEPTSRPLQRRRERTSVAGPASGLRTKRVRTRRVAVAAQAA
jgi:RNA polymerase sigma factor for flagellar operon FliA